MEALGPQQRTGVINIFGVAGSGCSALAQEVAQRCLEFAEENPDDPHSFDGIIWISKQRVTLTPDGNIPPQNNGSWTLDDLFTSVASTLGKSDFLSLRPSERMVMLPGLLREGHYLLILNDVDEVNDDRVNQLLNNLPVPTKVIVTSHAQLNVASLPIYLSGLERDEAIQLLKQDALRHQLNLFHNASPVELEQVLVKTDRLPFVLRWSVAQLSNSGKPLSWLIGQLAETNNQQLTRYCLDLTIKDLKPPEHRLLQAFSLLPQPVRLRAGEAISRLHGDELDRSLTRLTKLHLIRYDTSSTRYTPMLLARQYALQELEADPSLKEVFTRRAVEEIYAQVQQNGHWREDKSAAESLEAELSNIIWGIQQAYNLKDWNKVLGFWRPSEFWKPLEDFLYCHGYYNESLQVGKLVYDAAQELGDYKARGWSALYPMTRMFYYQGLYDDAQHWCAIGLDAFKQLLDESVIAADDRECAIASAERYMGRILMEKGELDQAEKYFTNGLERALKLDQQKFHRLQGNLLASRASLAEARKSFFAAQEDYERALKL
jgi:hypothetical protein